MPRYRARLAALALAAALTLAVACGDDDDDSGPLPEPSPSPALTLDPDITPGPGVTRTQIKVGITADLNGTGDTPYGAIAVALQAYADKVNAEDGGVCGRDLIVVAEDDRYSPEAALAATKKLVDQDQVLAVIGAAGTVVHQPVAGYLNDPNADMNTSDGVPDLFLSTGWSGWDDVTKYPWTIGYIPHYTADARILARYVNANFEGKKVGLLFEDNEFGRDYQAVLRPALTTPDLLVYEQPFVPDPAALSGQVAALRDAGAEIVVLASTPSLAAQVFVAAAAASYDPTFVLSYVNMPSGLASDIGGGTTPEKLVAGFEALDGSVWTEYLLSPVEDELEPAMVEHRRIMDTYGGPEMSTLSIYAQSLGELLVHTLNSTCFDLSRAGLMSAVEALDGFRSSLMLPGVQVILGPGDHQAIDTEQPVIIHADGTTDPSGGALSATP